MPTPIEILLHPVSLAAIGIYAALMIWEALFPARELPKVRFWKIRGLAMFGLFFYMSSYLPMLIDPLLAPFQLFDLTGLGTVGGAIAGLLVVQGTFYFWHRTMHRFDTLWKVFHQMHHSSERLDTYSAFYFSPMDMIGGTLVGSICFSLLIGLNPQSITIILLVNQFIAVFTHSNIRTAPWLGYFIQRPESHTLHHAKGLHKYNYCDLPIWDILFGTFRNAKDFAPETGFYHGASSRIGDMLLFRDVSTPAKQ